jgi:membrane associated rhomboid family serine protease
VLSVLLGIAIFVWIGWGAERSFGWRRYSVVILVSGIAAAALCGIALGGAAGLIGPVWGIFGAYLITVWDQPTVRNRVLITMVVWFLVSLFFGNIIAVIGGALGGIGTILLLRRYEGRTTGRSSTPYLILAAALAVLIALAILSSTIVAPLS